MLNYHDIGELNGKISPYILDLYKVDYNNFTLSSIVASFHRVYGLRNEGNSISIEIINNIRDNPEDIHERNILVWNLHVLSKEYMAEGRYDKAIEVIERAEKNWSRDVILGDEIGVYHVSWIEQIWHRKAEVYMMTKDTKSFEEVTDLILNSRYSFFKEANKITGETILQDRCTYNCYEIMALEKRKNNIELAVKIIKQAIKLKGGINLKKDINLAWAKEKEEKGNFAKVFELYLKYFNRLSDVPYDNIQYGYCKTCSFFDSCGKCALRNIETERYKACSQYKAKK